MKVFAPALLLALASMASARGRSRTLTYGSSGYSSPSYYALPQGYASHAGSYNNYNSYDSSGYPWWSRFLQSDFPDEREILPEWFQVDDPEDCDNIPQSVNTGRPRDLCGDNDLGTRFCICLKNRSSYRSSYQPVCGECRDPCALRFVPDTYPKRNEDNEENNNNENRDEDLGFRRN